MCAFSARLTRYGHDLGIRDAQIVDVHASPDGRSVAVTVDITTHSLDFYASFVQTVVLGVVGSFVGGFLGYVLFGNDPGEGGLQASGIIGSVIGAVIALLIYNAATHRGVGRRV